MVYLKDCPKCGGNSSMEYEDGEWMCVDCGYTEEGDEDEATAVGDEYSGNGCASCGNYDDLYPDCLDSCPMGE